MTPKYWAGSQTVGDRLVFATSVVVKWSVITLANCLIIFSGTKYKIILVTFTNCLIQPINSLVHLLNVSFY